MAGKTDVKDHETKQLSLFNAAQVPTKKQFVFDANGQFYPGGWSQHGSSKKINVKLEMGHFYLFLGLYLTLAAATVWLLRRQILAVQQKYGGSND